MKRRNAGGYISKRRRRRERESEVVDILHSEKIKLKSREEEIFQFSIDVPTEYSNMLIIIYIPLRRTGKSPC